MADNDPSLPGQAPAGPRASENGAILAQFVTASPNGISITSPSGNVALWNPAQEQITGLPASEVIGQPIWDVQFRLALAEDQTPEQYESLRTMIQAMLRDGLPSGPIGPYTMKIRRADGEICVLETTTFALDLGSRHQFASISRDVTREHNTVEQLRTITRAIEQSPVSIVITDSDGKIEYANPAASLVSGYPHEEIIGNNPRMFQSGLTPFSTYQDLWNTVKNGRDWHGLVQNRRKDGELYWEEMTASPVLDEAGMLVQIIGVKEDVSRRLLAEEALQRSEMDLRQLQNIAGIGTWLWYVHKNKVVWSDEMYRIFGVDKESFTGDLNAVIARAIHPEDRDRVNAANASVVQENQPAPLEYRVVWPDGTVRSVWAVASGVERDQQGNIVALSGIVQDITERRHAEEELRRQTETQAALLRLYSLATTDEKEYIAEALEEVLALSGSQVGYFHFFHADEIALDLFVWSKAVHGACSAVPMGHYPLAEAGIWADCARLGQPVIHNDYPNFPERRGLPEGHIPLTRHMSIPIMDGHGEVVAVLGVGNRAAPYEEEDATRVQVLGNVVWGWVERRRAQRAIDNINRELNILNRILSLATLVHEPDEVLRVVCTRMAADFGITRVTAVAWDDGRGTLRVAAQSPNPAYPSELGETWEVTDAAAIARLRTVQNPVLWHPIGSGAMADPCTDCAALLHTPAWVQAGLFIPIRLRNVLHVVLRMEYDSPHDHTDHEVQFCASVAQAIAPVYENSLLQQHMLLQNADLGDLVEARTRELEGLNDRLSTILNHVGDAIALIDRSGRIEQVNRAFIAAFGFTPDDSNRTVAHIESLTNPEQQGRLLQLFQATTVDVPLARSEFPMVRRDGSAFDAELMFSYVPDNHAHIVCSIRDVSHFKEVSRLKDQFVSMVSHELRTPVSTILLSANTTTAYYDRLSDDQKRAKLEQISRQANRLTDLVQAILEVARFDNRKSSGSSGPVDLMDTADALRGVAGDLLLEASQKQQELTLRLPGVPALARVARTDLDRVWQNLIGNAIKYSGSGAKIQAGLYWLPGSPPDGAWPDEKAEAAVEAEVEELRSALAVPSAQRLSLPEFGAQPWVVGVVQDTGPGIPEADLAHLFTRFFRGWAAGSKMPGTGLGLALVRDMLRFYNGDIAVSSSLGFGTTFCFWLPAEGASQP